MSKRGNYGVRVPLKGINLPTDKPAVFKNVSWSERIAAHNRNGAPPTIRQGITGLRPAAPELNPKLILNKALLAPPKVTPQGATPQKPRKRDSSGKFAPNQNVGKQSAALQDKEAAEREAELAARQQKLALNPNAVVTNKSVPGDDSGAADLYGQSKGVMIGNSSSGMPIYDDPYHPAHKDFTPDDHKEAASLHQQFAQQAQNPVQAALHQQRSSVHADLADDNKLPFERIMEQQYAGGGNANPSQQAQSSGPSGYSGPDALDSFLDPMHQEDQGKPAFAGRFSQGPHPGMTDNRTGSPVGPQTSQMGHAGTVPQPQTMPTEPSVQDGSMPELRGQDQSSAYGEPPQTAPFGGDAVEDKSKEKEVGYSATKSLEFWLSKVR